MVIEVCMSDYPAPEIPAEGDTLYLAEYRDKSGEFIEVEASHRPYRDTFGCQKIKGILPFYPFAHSLRRALGRFRVERVFPQKWPGQYYMLKVTPLEIGLFQFDINSISTQTV